MTLREGVLQGDRGKPHCVENPRLLEAMQAIALDDNAATRKKVYAELLRATLIFPTPKLNAPPGVHFKEGSATFQIVGLKDAKGIDVTVAFTDDEALRNWDAHTPSVVMAAIEYFEMLVPLKRFEVVIVNPFIRGPKMVRPGGYVTRREFELLAKGILPEHQEAVQTIRAAGGEKLRLQRTDESFPDDVMARVREFLACFREVQSAFLVLASFGKDAPHRAIVVSFSAAILEKKQQVFAKTLVEIIRPQLAEKEMFDVIPVNAESALAREAVKSITPFYQRPLQ